MSRDKPPHATSDSGDVAHALNRRCYPQTENATSLLYEQLPILVTSRNGFNPVRTLNLELRREREAYGTPR